MASSGTPGTPRQRTAAIVGAGDFIGAAIARKFAAEGYTVFLGRRQGELLAPVKAEIEAAGGRAHTRSLDAREEDQVVQFLADAEAEAPLEVVIFNVGANVNFPLLETTSRVFCKVWEMACYSGFPCGREAARLMLPRGHGSIFFTGATAGLRGGDEAGAQIRPDPLMRPQAVADAYWAPHQQPRDAWVFEQEIRPYAERW